MSERGLQIARRMEAERVAQGLSKKAIYEAAGVTSGMYPQWLAGSEPKGTTLVLIAQKLGVNERWLATGKGPKYPGERDAEEISDDFMSIRQVEFKISAGVSGFVVEYLNGERAPLFFRRDWIEARGFNPEKLHAIEVTGSSMEPNLWEGDLSLIHV